MIAAVGVSSNEDAGDNEVNSSQSPALQVHDNATLTLAQAASDLSATSEVSKDASWLDPTDVRSLPRPASSRAIPANGVRKANGIVPERHDISPPKKAMPIPSALPRSNSISAISTRFRGKLAERRNSGTVARTAPQAKITPVPTQSAHSSDSDSEDDSDSDSNVTPEQLPNGKERRIGLAALR